MTLEGDAIPLKSYPAAVMLTLHKRPKCVGVLIGPAWALTSAYCLSGSEISAMKVVAGREDSSRRDDPDEQVADIIEVYEHPLYKLEPTIQFPLPFVVSILFSVTLYAALKRVKMTLALFSSPPTSC